MRGKHSVPAVPSLLRRNIPAYAGKTHWPQAQTSSVMGTSPRMRGKPHCTPPTVTVPRNIPAYAGKTPWGRGTPSAEKEHPRVCGENVRMNCVMLTRHGTSPRMRGKRPPAALFEVQGGNIPAYAGKTYPQALGASRWPEHPRVCGENLLGCLYGCGGFGTSPRMRGKHGGVFYRNIRVRNIPAYAGKTESGRVAGQRG